MIKHSAFRTFVTVAELGNIVDASEKLGRTPSATSMTLKQLEQSLGGRLFESDRKSKLTAFGEFVLRQARIELECYERTVASMRAFARNQIGNLRIACVPSVAMHIMPMALHEFIAARPQVELDLRDVDTLTAVKLVESGEVDIGIGGFPPRTGTVRFELLFQDRFMLVCAKENPLARLRRPMRARDISGQVLIRNDASDKIEVEWLKEAFLQSRLKVRNVTSLLAMVRKNIGIAILPELSVSAYDDHVASLRIEDDRLFRKVGFLTSDRSSLTPLGVSFQESIRDFCRRTLSGRVASGRG